MKNLKYKFRLYPNKSQELLLNQFIGCNRFIWNYFLNLEQEQYKLDQTFRFYHKNSKDLPGLKETYEWLKLAPATSLQQTLRFLDRGLKDSFKKSNDKKGFPKFKRKQKFDGSFSLVDVNLKKNCDFINNKFKIPNLGWVRTVFHRQLPGDFKSATIIKEANNWYVSITTKKPKQPKKQVISSVGIDLNSRTINLSNGEVIPIQKYLYESQGQIKKLQKILSRKTKGSNNYHKIQLKLRKNHNRIRNKRLDFFHKLSYYLVTNYDLISLEDLNVKGIQQWNGHITKDNGLSMLRQFCEYKSELYGSTTVILDRYYPSSQICSECGSIKKIPLSIRTYNCSKCGLVIDRDHNAAINIDRAGTALYASGDTSVITYQVLIGKLLGVSMNEEAALSLDAR